MCDFAIWNGKIEKEDVEYLGLECGSHNRDATGISFTLDDSIKTLKGPVEAEEFFTSAKWDALWDGFGRYATSGMVHCRIATNGSPQNNINNHPHVTESGSVLVHKGIVRPIKHMEDAVSDCDSEQLLRSLDLYGLADGLQNVSGWAHIAYMPFYQRDFMFLYSNSTPLEYHEFDNDLVIVNTSHLDTAVSTREVLYSEELDLDTWFTLNLTGSEPYGGLETWKKNMTLSDTHETFFGKSERGFRSKLPAKNS